MKKYLPFLLTIAVPMIILTSCAVNKNYQAKVGLHYTGVYTVKEISGKTVRFKEVAGTYKVDSDTLKVNDRITINVVRKSGSNQNSLVKN